MGDLVGFASLLLSVGTLGVSVLLALRQQRRETNDDVHAQRGAQVVTAAIEGV